MAGERPVSAFKQVPALTDGAYADIPVVLVISILLLGCFVAWEWYIENRTTRPPLMSLGLWSRAKGKFAVVQAVVFFDWSCFTTWV